MYRQRRPKRKAGLGYILILLLILIVFAAGAVFVSRRFAPSKAQADLDKYYNLTAYGEDRPAAGDDELAIIYNDTILDTEDARAYRAVRRDGGIYIGLSLVQDYIDSRFYLDKNQNLVIFTDALDSYVAETGSTVCSVNGSDRDMGYVIARTVGDEVYLHMEFVKAHSPIEYDVLSEPARLYIRNFEGTAQYTTAKADIRIRTSDNKKSAIVATIPKGDKVRVLSASDGWMKVIDDNGYIGYIQDNFTGETESVSITSDYQEPEYTHILMDDKINMVWHGIYYYESNQYLPDYTAEMTGVNVLAPTWFLFLDTEGNILTYANQDYVNYAHEHGWKVWAVLEDMDGESCVDILPYTYKRQTAINQMIQECMTYGIDGINVDLETVTSSTGNDFIQFLRELSAACRKNGLVLSVADYAPYNYNAFRHTDEQSRICDYVAIMAYDDYVGTNEAGPNAGLPFMDEVLNLCRNTVDMNRLIIGIPFYTRIWYEYGDGSLGSETYGMGGDMEDLIWNHGLTFEWKEEIGYEYAEYEQEDTTVRIWYENARSLEAKLKLLQEYDIAGIAAWRLGQETSDIWPLLAQYY